MKIAHSASIRVFCGEEENEAEVTEGLKWLVPLDLEKEKIVIQRHNALGFGDRRIAVFEVALTKERHVKAFIENLLQKLPEQQEQLLMKQLDSRIDDQANFFVRFEKEILAKHRDLLVTDGGNCYHVRIKIASFPSTKKSAVTVMKKVLAESLNK
ncbi:hypothetical protein HYV85_02065 [Candidatus Woesearchaeota archaeon]|nr:hypothetical protein [Candidatus Woesearchaeota archaeon]